MEYIFKVNSTLTKYGALKILYPNPYVLYLPLQSEAILIEYHIICPSSSYPKLS